jgi:hypothetical protein
MTSYLDDVTNMANANNYGTSDPDYMGGAEYSYVGAYTGGDDVLGGILDKLLDEPFDDSFEDTIQQEGGYEQSGGRCPMCDIGSLFYGGCDTCGESIIVNSESHTYDGGSLVVDKKETTPPKQSSSTDNVKMTDYSEVHSFITEYIKSIGDDKTVKENN